MKKGVCVCNALGYSLILMMVQQMFLVKENIGKEEVKEMGHAFFSNCTLL